MYEPSQRQVDSDLEKSMAMFRRAEVGELAPLEPIQPKHVLLALDGSEQDPLGVQIAKQLRDRLNCAVTVVDGREAALATNDISSEFAKTLDAQVIDAASLGADDASYDRILAAIKQSGADLAIAPSPFGRDLSSVGADSTGTVIDVLLARSPVPVIVVRDEFAADKQILSRVRVILSGENRSAPRAAQWAAGLLSTGGTFELMLLVETEFYDNVREALHALHPEEDIKIQSLETALAKIHSRLHAQLQAASDEYNFSYELLVEHEGEDQPFAEDETANYLVVLAIEAADHASQSHAHDLIRRSPHPVLIVPRDGRES